MTIFRSAWSVTFLRMFLLGLVLQLNVSQHLPGQTAPPPISADVERFPSVVRVNVAVKANLKSDLRFNAVVHARDYSRKQIIISKELVIPAGQTSVETEISLLESSDTGLTAQQLLLERNNNERPDPQDYLVTSIRSIRNSWQGIDSYLYVSSKLNSPNSISYNCNGKWPQRSGTQSTIGFSSLNQLPNFSTLTPYYNGINGVQAGSVTTSLSFLQNPAMQFYAMHPAEFFHNWQSLVGFRGLFISQQDLKTLTRDKKSSQALSHWIAVGGRLIVFDCDQNYANREQVLKLLTTTNTDISRDREWFSPTKEIEAMEMFARYNYGFAEQSGLVTPDDLPKKRLEKTETFDGKHFLTTAFLNGHVTLIDDDMTAWKTEDWQVLFNATYELGHFDHVLGTEVINRGFQQAFRLPGIGEPPVLAFQFLIWLFLILTGPVCYVLFYRSGRLHLLLASTPLISLAAVSALLLYAFLNDGFNLRGRAQSVTTIDHQTGIGVTHERQVYYSGVSPRPCQFAPATLVVDARSSLSPYTRYRYREEDRLDLSGGQVKARSHYQFTCLSCRDVEQSVSFSKSMPDAEQITVSNGFSNQLRCVAFHSPNGWYLAKDIGTQSTAIANKVSPGEAAAAIAKQLGSFGGSVRSSAAKLSTKSQIGTFDLWGESNRVLENLSNCSLDDFAENTYIAIVEESEFVSKPQRGTLFEGTPQHVIIGKQ